MGYGIFSTATPCTSLLVGAVTTTSFSVYSHVKETLDDTGRGEVTSDVAGAFQIGQVILEERGGDCTSWIFSSALKDSLLRIYPEVCR
jgi:hypothetical protein